MRIAPPLVLLLTTVLLPIPNVAQQPIPQRDPQALSLLANSLVMAGGARGIPSTEGFTASGTIVYFWAGEKVSAQATVRARGADQFRLDADLPEGKRSYALSRGRGSLKQGRGETKDIPYHNTINAINPIFPYPALAAALADQLTSVSYVALVEVAGRQTHQIRVQRGLPPGKDPDGVLSKLMTTTYFVDAQTSLMVRVSDVTHSVESFLTEYPRDLELEDYKNIDGVNVPTLVREKIDGQTVWELHLTTVAFNANYSDADFVLN